MLRTTTGRAQSSGKHFDATLDSFLGGEIFVCRRQMLSHVLVLRSVLFIRTEVLHLESC